jgi:hypothetical protein
MGNKIVRKFNDTGGGRTYTGYNYSSYAQYASPLWNSSYECLAKNSGDGEGLDWHKAENEELYANVFKKYYLPYLDPKLSSWSDRYPPYVKVYNVGNAFGFVGQLNLQLEETLFEGFTVDYENGILTFNERYFLYQTDANDEITSMRAPIVKVFLWKKNYYTYTSNPSENPETDISNPLMFFTDKMGDYPDTIIKDLNLSSLSIQIGGTRILSDGSTEFIPSWDDTAFAEDVAAWELSKICDKKIRGGIEITLDALCFYNINLTNRIYIEGITEEPMNITSINYNISNFTVRITLENSRYYNRSVSFQSHGE